MSKIFSAALVLAIGAATSTAQAKELKPFRVGFNAWIGSIAFFVGQERASSRRRGSTCRPRASARPATG
jgi:ABC-type nitrate/sulfonate/bicarbonate transport system substrate-binding protein